MNLIKVDNRFINLDNVTNVYSETINNEDGSKVLRVVAEFNCTFDVERIDENGDVEKSTQMHWLEFLGDAGQELLDTLEFERLLSSEELNSPTNDNENLVAVEDVTV